MALPLLLLGSSAVAAAPTRQVLPGHIPKVVAGLPPLNQLAATNHLRLAIGLPLHNQAALSDLLQQIYDPASPNYHHYLTPAQFTARFGPTEQDYNAVIAFAQANGLSVVGTYSNRMLLDVAGSAGDIEKAFQVKLQVYQHPTENRTFFAPDVEPSVPVGLPVLDISGLSDYSRPHPKYVIRPANLSSKVASKAGSGPGGNYMGYDFRAAYAPGVALTGTEQTVALVQFDGYDPNDIAQYVTQAGLPGVPLEDVLVDGFSGQPTGTGGEVEVSLDIEMVISMAPDLSKVIVYEGNPFNFFPNDVLNRIAGDDSANQVSSSWGWSGGPDATTDQIFQQMAAQGQSYFNATGDSDAFPPGFLDNPSEITEPSGSPYIMQVGATTLTTTGPEGAWLSEKVWNWGGGVGSSGGSSSYYTIPTWQQGVSMANNGGSTTMRNVPDVAMVGDNIYVIADSGLQYEGVGGTSVAAPLWGSFTALANEQAKLNGKSPVGFLNPAIYDIGLGPNYNSDFHDITTGNNTSPSSPNAFFAVAGYDLCTGWGTPQGANLISDLAGVLAGSGLLQLSVSPPAGSTLIASSTQPVFVTVTDVSSITNATVTGAIPGVTNLTFLDDGQPPDVKANDGIYSATLRVPASTGLIAMTVTATATNEIGATNVYSYAVVAPPLNDDFTNSLKVPPGGASYLSNNRFATLEPGEPVANGVASLWWSWTPVANTNVFIDTTGSAIDTELAVYTGSRVSALNPVIAVNDVGTVKQAFLNFDAVAGTTYRIAVTSSSTNSVGPLRLAVVPGGHRDTNAPVVLVGEPLSGQWVSNKIITVSGTAGDPPPDATGVSQVVLTVNGVYQFVATGTTNWSGLVALRSGLNNLEVTAQDAAGNVSAPVDVQVSYVPTPNPPNDLFANALPLTGTPEEVTVTTTNATKEYGEPDHAGNTGGKSVWWWYQPPADGVLVLNTTNSTFDTLLALYTGTNVANLTTIAANDDAYDGAPGGFSLIEQAVRSNQVYHIAVDGYGGASGAAVVHYSFTPATVYHLTTSNSPGGVVLVTTANSLGGDAVMSGTAGDFASNSLVTLTAVPQAYSQFSDWQGSLVSSNNPLSVVMSGDMNLVAFFQPEAFSDGFESGDLSAVDWTTGGNAPWFVQTNVVDQGRYAARSGVIGDSQSSSLFFTTNFFPGAISFDYKVSSETNFDWFGFYVDGVLVQQWSGEVGWANFTFPLSPGVHTLEWRYTKDPSLSAGLDAAFLDDVNLPLVAPKVIGAPAYLQLVRQGNGAFAVNLQGSAYAHYVLQVSTNLIDWQNLSTNTATGGFILIPDPASVSNSIRFYRAVGAP